MTTDNREEKKQEKIENERIGSNSSVFMCVSLLIGRVLFIGTIW